MSFLCNVLLLLAHTLLHSRVRRTTAPTFSFTSGSIIMAGSLHHTFVKLQATPTPVLHWTRPPYCHRPSSVWARKKDTTLILYWINISSYPSCASSLFLACYTRLSLTVFFLHQNSIFPALESSVSTLSIPTPSTLTRTFPFSHSHLPLWPFPVSGLPFPGLTLSLANPLSVSRNRSTPSFTSSLSVPSQGVVHHE